MQVDDEIDDLMPQGIGDEKVDVIPRVNISTYIQTRKTHLYWFPVQHNKTFLLLHHELGELMTKYPLYFVNLFDPYTWPNRIYRWFDKDLLIVIVRDSMRVEQDFFGSSVRAS
jgi:hypothetical protein